LRNERSDRPHRTGDRSSTERGHLGQRIGPEDRQREPHKPVMGWRLWLFRLGAVIVVPVALLVLAELSLRVVGYGFPPATTVKCKVQGKDAWCDNCA